MLFLFEPVFLENLIDTPCRMVAEVDKLPGLGMVVYFFDIVRQGWKLEKFFKG